MSKFDGWVAPITKEMKIFITMGLMSEDECLRAIYVKASKAITAADLLYYLQFLPDNEITKLDKLKEKYRPISPKPKCLCNTKFAAAAMSFYPATKCPFGEKKECERFDVKECTATRYRLRCKNKYSN